MDTKVHFSSATDLWETPQAFFNELNEQYEFELDVCATPENAKCTKFYTQEQDGLKQIWYAGGRLSFVWFQPVQIQNGGMNTQ